MGRSAQPGIRRREQLLEILRGGSTVDTARLALALRVSEMTIRRDLRILEKQNKILRSYGGATLARRVHLEFEFDQDRQKLLPAKQRIGEYAASLVEPDDTIFVDTGTTTLEFARILRRRDIRVTVATSSLAVGSELWGHPRIRVLMLGGQLRAGSPDLTGPLCEHSLNRLHATRAFVGCDALDATRGYFAADAEGARVSAAMLRYASWKCIIADASKLNKQGTVRYAGLGDVDLLIIDDSVPLDALDQLRQGGRRVHVVGGSNKPSNAT